jgi:hypothetical protein
MIAGSLLFFVNFSRKHLVVSAEYPIFAFAFVYSRSKNVIEKMALGADGYELAVCFFFFPFH